VCFLKCDTLDDYNNNTNNSRLWGCRDRLFVSTHHGLDTTL